MSNASGNWYYANKGEAVGPFESNEIQEMAGNGEINGDTSVWDGDGDWKSAKETVLNQYFHQRSDTPPPLSGHDVDNRFVWGIVSVPIIGSALELLFFGAATLASSLLYIIPNIALSLIDEKRLKKAGHQAPNTFWVLIVPVYLWKRATLLKQSRNYFFAWIATLIISMFITAGGSDALIADAACPIVTDIISSQLYGSAACKAVEIHEEVSSGFYRGTAILDNGNELRVAIEEKGNGQIYVTIPNQ